MGVGFTLDAEGEGRGEDVLVVVGRTVEQSDSLAMPNPHAPDLRIAARSALEGADRACPADDLVRCRCGPDPLVDFPLVWMVEQCQHACGCRIASRLVTGNYQQQHEVAKLDFTEFITVGVSRCQACNDVLGRAFLPLDRNLI